MIDFFLWWYLYIRIIHKKINQNGITKRRYAARLTIFAQAPFLPACNGIAYRIAFFMFTFQLKNKRKVAKHLKTFYFTWCTLIFTLLGCFLFHRINCDEMSEKQSTRLKLQSGGISIFREREGGVLNMPHFNGFSELSKLRENPCQNRNCLQKSLTKRGRFGTAD